MSANTEQRHFPKGSRLGPYEIASSIGAGGMGEVFRARDTRLNRDVAVKVLPKDFVADADRLRRFEEEAKTLAALNHPNVLTIHDAGVHEGAPYLVSELLEGKTLREEMNSGALPVRKATEYGLQMAHGLAAANGKGVTHRDLKPENIFVTKDGRVKILDFGLAKLRPDQKSEIRNQKLGEAATIRIDPDAIINTTEPGMVLGTPAYMSPEQVRGEPADHRADIFAFGCVLYEMLSGARAFRRNTPVESMNAVLIEALPELGTTHPNIPLALARIVERCLEKQPDNRFQSAKDLAFALEAAREQSTSGRGGTQREAGLGSRRSRAVLVTAVILLFVAGTGWWFVHRPGTATKSVADSPGNAAATATSNSSPAVSATPAADQKSIAVLAFANLSEDKGNEIFSEGVSEELLNVLAKIPGLKVTARTSAFHFKDKDTPIPEIATQLGVAYVVEGSVRKSGERVRITAQLIKAADGFHVWSDTFTRELKDIFAVQDEIAALIAQQLQLKLEGASASKKVVNPDAYRLTLEGHHFWLQRTEESLARAEAAYRQALEYDPQFAQAHAGLAEVWMIRGWYRAIGGIFPPNEDFARAKSEAQLALRLDPTLAEPHATLGVLLYNERKFAESEQEFQEALRLNPNYSFAHHWRAHPLMTIGRLDVAIEELDRAVQLDPLSFVTLLIDSMWLSFAGRYDEALALNDRALALGPEGFVPTRGDRSLMLLNLGRKDEAVASARMITNDVNHQPRWWSDASAIHVLHQAGLEQEAEDYATRFLATLPANSYLRSFVSVALGRNDEALAQLSQFGTASSGVGSVFYSTLWDGVRNDPRFLPIIAKLGYAKEYQVARETRARLSKLEPKK